MTNTRIAFAVIAIAAALAGVAAKQINAPVKVAQSQPVPDCPQFPEPCSNSNNSGGTPSAAR